MSAASLILESARHGIFLFHQDGQLRFEQTAEVFPLALREKIIANREAILAYLIDASGDDPPRDPRPPIEPQGRAGDLPPLS